MGFIDNYRSNSAYEAVVGSTQKANGIVAAVQSTKLDLHEWGEKHTVQLNNIQQLVAKNPDTSTWSKSEINALGKYFESVWSNFYARADFAYALCIFNKMQLLQKSVLEGLGKMDARRRFNEYENELQLVLGTDYATSLFLSSSVDQLKSGQSFNPESAIKNTKKLLKGSSYKLFKRQPIDFDEIIEKYPIKDEASLISYIENLTPDTVNKV